MSRTAFDKLASDIGYSVQQYEQHIQDNAKAEDIAEIAASVALTFICEELLSPNIIDSSAGAIWSYAQELGEERLDVDPTKQECISMAIHALNAAVRELKGDSDV